MKLASVKYVVSGTLGTARRFPAVTALCLAAFATACSLVYSPSSGEDLRTALMMALGFGALLFFGLRLMAERFPLPAPARPWHFELAGAALVLGFYLFFAGRLGLDTGDRCAQWCLCAGLFITFAPYLRAAEPGAFWQFNRRLVLRYFVSLLYTLVLFAGISLALTAVEKLFGVEIPHKTYGYLWSLAGCVFWPLHFMAAAPSDHPALAADQSYPRGLKLFTQYVLLPLATVYFAILYAYMGKILLTQQWPQGWVSWLTSSASLLGLAAFLLLYPAAQAEENGWINKYSRGFCLAALPLLVMLFTAVYKRIAQHGITEHRYFLVCLGAWLAGVFVYFVAARKPDIRKVPMSAAAVALLVSLGPWGAYAVSLRSQSSRLEGLMAANGLLAGGKAVKLDHQLPPKTRAEISGIVDYILRYHGPEALKKYFPADLPALVPAAGGTERWEHRTGKGIMAYMGQEYLDQWDDAGRSYVAAYADDSGMDVRGYDSAARFSIVDREAALPADRAIRGVAARDGGTLRLFRGKDFLAEVPLAGVKTALEGGGGRVPQEQLCAAAGNAAVKLKVCFDGVHGDRGAGGLKMHAESGFAFIKENR